LDDNREDYASIGRKSSVPAIWRARKPARTAGGWP
jgi:hypothetical protein